MMYSVGAGVGETGCEATDWTEDVSVVCKRSTGYLLSAKVIVTSGLRQGTLSSTMSHDVGKLSSVLPSNSHVSAGTIITTSGSNYGVVFACIVSSTGDTASEETNWIADTSVVCKQGSGQRASLAAVVTAG
eukprot:3760396-Rhodomonas_salina.1